MREPFRGQLGDDRCPHDYPWFRDGRCWSTAYYDNMSTYGDSVEALSRPTDPVVSGEPREQIEALAFAAFWIGQGFGYAVPDVVDLISSVSERKEQ